MSFATAEALSHWPLDVSSCVMAAQRENVVFRVDTLDGRSFALRFHRPGYRSAEEIVSELQWMQALAAAGISVPLPVETKQNALVVKVGDFLVDMLTWLDGAPMGKAYVPLTLPDAPQVFFSIGENMARLHDISDSWQRPHNFTRPSWDVEALLGEQPLWGRFWENPTLNADDRKIVDDARQKLGALLKREAAALDFGLIHADLVRENVLIQQAGVRFIDFDDSGFGFRLFDIATTLFRNSSEPDFEQLKASLLEGYRTQRHLNAEILYAFMLLRAFTYLGWTMQRIGEPGMEERNQRNIEATMPLAHSFLVTFK